MLQESLRFFRLKASLQNLKKIHTHAKLNKDQRIRKLIFPKIKISVYFSPSFPVALLPTLCKPLQCVLPLCHNLLHVFCCQNILLLLILPSYFIKCTLLLLALLSFAIRTCINSDHSLFFSSLLSCCRFGLGCDGSSSVRVHALRHGVAEGLLEAAGKHSPAMDGERAHWAGAGC